MSDNENPDNADFSHVTRRLEHFGSAPLAADVEARALARLRAGRPPSRRVSRTKLLSAAAVAAFLASGVGLAAADVLPPSAQDVAHNALNAVGVHVPPGHERYNDATVCPGGPYANHGAYVRAHPNDPNAGKSPCGKPTRSVNPSSPGAENDKGKGARNGSTGAQGKKDQADKNQGKSDEAKNDGKDGDDPDDALQPSNTVPKSPASTSVSTSTTTVTTSPQTTTTTSTTTPASTTTST